MILLKADLLQDVRVSGARRALKDRAARAQPVNIEEASNEPFIPSGHLKTMTLRPLPTTRLSKTIPLGSSLSITGKSKARALRKVGSRMCVMTRAMNSSLPTSTSTLAPLLRQVPGTAGNQPGMIANRDMPVRPIGRSFRAMTGRFSGTTCILLDLVALKLLRDIPLPLTW